MWTVGGTVITDLHTGPAFNPGGTLNGYIMSFAGGVSADGQVVGGTARDITITNAQAFRWTQATGMVGLGFLPGYTSSGAGRVSADGQTLVGSVSTASTSEAMYWTQATGMVGLGRLGGSYSWASDVNRDGSVIVGTTTISSGQQRAFRWTQTGGMEDLGVAPGGTFSTGSAVSADGSVVVGTSSGSADGAVRWTRATGMQRLASLLSAGGVNLGNWTLNNATGVSADGKVIIGAGTNAGVSQSYIARCESLSCQGLTTAGDVAKSFSGQSAFGQTANAAIGGALGTMQEYATQAHQSQGSRSSPYSVFAYGAYDSDPVASGTLGMTVDLPFNMIAGFAASANHVKTEMVYDGNAKMNGGSFGVFLAHLPDTGLQWLAGATAMTLKGDVTRGYLNGVSPSSSTGSTSGDGHGFIARAGWAFAALPQTKVTPFASYTNSLMRFDGYTETNGVFPARFDGFKSTVETGRLGADIRYTFGPGQWLWGTLAWAHRLDDGKAPDITGTLIDFSPMTVPGVSVGRDWLEVGGGVRLPAWKTGAVTASLTASVPAEGVTTYLARVGLTQAF